MTQRRQEKIIINSTKAPVMKKNIEEINRMMQARGIVVGAKIKKKIALDSSGFVFGTIMVLRPQNNGVLIKFDNDNRNVHWGLSFDEFDIIPASSEDDINLGRVFEMLPRWNYKNNYEVDKDHD
jgi:hypothetical protein